MSNKIINFSTQTEKNQTSNEIYVDVDMNAEIKPPTGVNWGEYYSTLTTEKDEYGNMEDILTEDDKEELYLTYAKTKDYDQAMWQFLRKSPYRTKKIVNIASIQNSLKNIFTWMKGERIINPEFGSDIRELLYEQITNLTEERIVAEINSSVSRWEPRVKIVQIINVSDVSDTDDNVIRLDIKYKIVGLDNIYTYTYIQNNAK